MKTDATGPVRTGDQVYSIDDFTRTPVRVQAVYRDGSFDLEPCSHVAASEVGKYEIFTRCVDVAPDRAMVPVDVHIVSFIESARDAWVRRGAATQAPAHVQVLDDWIAFAKKATS